MPFSRFCFISRLSSKECIVCCPLGSPPRWAACARLDLALLPVTFYYELRQDLLLHRLNSGERFSLSLLCTVASGWRRTKRAAAMEHVNDQESFKDNCRY